MTPHPCPDGGGTLSVPAVAHHGGTAHLVRIRAVPESDQSDVRLLGLGGDHPRHTRDRLRAALLNSGLAWPQGGLTLSVSTVPAAWSPRSLDGGVVSIEARWLDEWISQAAG